MIEGFDRSNEVIAKHLRKYEQAEVDLSIGEKLELINFVPMYSKEESERVKRQGLNIDQGSLKRMKTSKSASEDVYEEELKGMLELVPLEEVYVEALQVKHPIIDLKIHSKGKRDTKQASRDKEKELWVEVKRLFKLDYEDQLWTHHQAFMHDSLYWKLYDTCGVHHVFTKDQEIFMLVERDYPLRKGLATVMITQDEELIEASSPNLSSLALDELIDNLKVHEVVMEKDSKIYRGKTKRTKSITLKYKKESSDDENLTSKSDDKEYVMVVRNFKKFFRRKGKFVRKPREEKKSFRQRDEKKGKSNQKCFRYGDPNHLIGDCLKPSRNKDQKAFIGGSWSDSENDAEDKTSDETCLIA
nr:zf-CCHC domain-containing protein/UBN2 domain-containing protein [Tanacetum cinerariifolium]